LPDFLGTIYQHGGKCTKLPQNRPNVHKIYQNLPLQGPPKFAQIRILGLKKVPSGNPVSGARTFGSLEMNATKFFLAKKRSQKKVRKKSGATSQCFCISNRSVQTQRPAASNVAVWLQEKKLSDYHSF
jgi:hypothetical protein